MRRSIKKLLSLFGVAVLVSTLGVVMLVQPAAAAANPSFKVTCYPQGMAQNDPIVFPGQAGASHMHSFFGARGVDQNTTIDTLLRQPSSQCGSDFGTVDLSAYWIPTLYKDDQPVHDESGAHQLAVYYQRAGGPNGAPAAQAFPRGLKIIAGDMRATTPQANVTYVCAKSDDAGQQRGGGNEFLTCNADELFIAKLVFPDCWDGKNLDSANHKSHMAFSGGSAATCPSTHPVKLPQITFEAWYHGVNGPASSFRWASGGAYTFHGDVISAWDLQAAANLVNQCINVAFDCNPLPYGRIPRGTVTQPQIDAQLAGTSTVSPPPPAAPGDAGHGSHESGTGATPAATTAPAATPTPTPTPTRVPSATPTPSHHHGGASPSPTAGASAGSGGAPPAGQSPVAWLSAFGGAMFAALLAWGIARRLLPRRRR